MALVKSASTQIGSKTGITTGGNSYTSNTFDVSNAIACEIELVYTFATAPTTGTVNIEVYEAADGVNFSSFPVYTNYVTPTASGRMVFVFDAVAFNNIQVKVINNTDQSVDATINAVKTSI